MLDKAALRKAMRTARQTMAPEDVRARSERAQLHVMATEQWKAASSVALYAAVRNETETALLLEDAWSAGKRVFLPYTATGVPGLMHLLPYENGQTLTKSAYGIPEPSPGLCPPAGEGGAVPDCVIVPGVAFDQTGRRLGNGGGYYDRLLAKESMRGVFRMGFGYAFQVVEEVPGEAWDVPVNAIVTEEGALWL